MSDIHLGFLLTRSSRESDQTEIEYWAATDLGPVLLRIPAQRPLFFIKQQNLKQVQQILDQAERPFEVKAIELKTFDGQPAAAVYSSTSRNSYVASRQLSRAGIEVFEADLRACDRYLMERFAYGGIAFSGVLTQKEGYLEAWDCQLKPADFQPRLKVLSLDIECALDGQLFSVGLASGGRPVANEFSEIAEVLMIGSPQADTDTAMHWFQDEKSLLLGLCARIRTIDPDLIIGWNLINFDMRILLERATKHNLKLHIGRASRAASWRSQRNEPGKGYVTIPGRVAIDGIDALRSATWRFPSFSLENVARTLLDRGKKVEPDVDDRFAEIEYNFLNNKPALAAYNLEDCRLVLDIFEHTQIIEYLVLRSQITGLELDRSGGSVAAFTNLYLPRLHRGGYVAPNLPTVIGEGSPGGYVMDSKPGLYRNVLVLDFKSLYPAIIRTFKIDPMGLIEGLAEAQHSIPGFRGARFHRNRHYLPQIITDLWLQRDQAKHDNDKVRSQAIKILMNSFYGVLGSTGCRFYDERLASSITMRGHQIMQITATWIEEQGYAVIYGDTDSLFVSLDQQLPAAACQQIGRQLADLIDQRWQHELRSKYDLKSLLEIEFETHFSRFLMPTIRGSEAGSKKRYAGLVIDSKNDSEHIVFKGLENVRTDWTEVARKFQADLFDCVFHDRDPQQIVRDVVREILAGEYDQMLVYRKQLRRKLKMYVKNVPPHVRAARMADQRNKTLGKSLKYQNRGWINYVVTVNGPQPVEYLESAIDYSHYIDKQIKPIGDGVLPFIDEDFDSIISNQIQLF